MEGVYGGASGRNDKVEIAADGFDPRAVKSNPGSVRMQKHGFDASIGAEPPRLPPVDRKDQRPISEKDEKARYRSAPASKPGAVTSGTVTEGTGTSKSGALASEPGPSSTSHLPQTPVRGEKAGYRNVPASKPGAFSAPSEPGLIDTTSRAQSGDEKAAYRTTPLRKPAGGAAAGAAASEPGVSLDYDSAHTPMPDEKARFRHTPASRPGVFSTPLEPAVLPSTGTNRPATLDEKAGYRTALNSTTTLGTTVGSVAQAKGTFDYSGNADEKARYRKVPSQKPGAAFVEPATPTLQTGDVVDEKAAYRNPPASKPLADLTMGETGNSSRSLKAVEPDFTITKIARDPSEMSLGGSFSVSGSVSSLPPRDSRSLPGAAIPSLVPRESSEKSLNQSLSSARQNSGKSLTDASTSEKSFIRTVPASRPGVVALASKESSEKSLIRTIPASRPGAVSTAEDGATTASSAPASDKQSVQATSRVRYDANVDARAVVQIVDRDLASKQRSDPPASRPGVMSSADASATVQLVESDLLAKQRARPEEPAAKPGVISEADAQAVVTAVESDMLAKQRARAGAGNNFNDDKSRSINAKVAAAGYDVPSGSGVGRGYDAPEDEILMSMDHNMTAKVGQSLETHGKSSLEVKIHEMDGVMPEDEAAKDIMVNTAKFIVDDPYEDGGLVGAKDDKKTLAVAVPVDEEAERENLVEAEDFEPSDKMSIYRRPWFISLVLCISIACIIGLVAGLVEGTKKQKAQFAPNAPTHSPTMAPTTTGQHYLRVYLDSLNISDAVIKSAPVAYEMAVDWYANVDPGRNRSIPDSSYRWEFDRFILAWFYYASSSNGAKPWLSCNPPNRSKGENDTCTFMSFSQASSDRSSVSFTKVLRTPRWLSKYNQCTWPGVTCLGASDVPTNDPLYTCVNRVLSINAAGFGLSGSLPIMVNQLRCFLAYLVSWNSGLTGPINPELFNVRTELSYQYFAGLVLLNNSNMAGPLPDALWDFPSLSRVEIGDNGITGTFPNLDGRATSLNVLHLFGNALGGTLPRLTYQRNLVSLRLHRDLTGFNGTIPSSYGSLSGLEDLWLFANRLTGSLPSSLRNCTSMQVFRISQNRLNGTFPNIYWPDLVQFEVQKNQLSGSLPPLLPNMTNLEIFIANENKFGGTIPSQIGKLLNLTVFLVQDNQIGGSIPSSLANLTYLTSLWLNYNNFQGEFPVEICRLRSLQGLGYITADCLGYPPKNYCFCCTSCCETDFRSCQTTDVVVQDEQSRRVLSASRTKHISWQSEPHFFAEYYDNIIADLLP